MQHDCTRCATIVDSRLLYKHLSKGEHIAKSKCAQNYMLFVLKGKLLVNSEEYPGTTLGDKQFMLQAMDSNLELLALTSVEYVMLLFNELPLICEDRYREIIDDPHPPLTYIPLLMKGAVWRFMEALPTFLTKEPRCVPYITMKCKELVFLIMHGYPLAQLRAFFYPISSYRESFQYFVMKNYSKVKNVEEFAHLGGYTLTTFRRLFKNLYGIPVYEWILDRKREGILDDLQHTNQRMTELCERYGFDSLSHLAHFCKESFGDTPRALRKRVANGEKIEIILQKYQAQVP